MSAIVDWWLSRDMYFIPDAPSFPYFLELENAREEWASLAELRMFVHNASLRDRRFHTKILLFHSSRNLGSFPFTFLMSVKSLR
jgi:hypothetical protein